MKTLTFILTIVFVILTFLGASYVIVRHGQANAGYALVPMVFALASLTALKRNLTTNTKTLLAKLALMC